MIVIILTLMLFTSDLIAPPYETIPILRGMVVNPYNRIIKAINWVESKDGLFMYNAKEQAVGEFGIRPIRLNDYNRRTGKHIILDQCYDYETSKMIFLYYASQFQPDDIKGICVNWNGKSKRNLYYAKILKQL